MRWRAGVGIAGMVLALSGAVPITDGVPASANQPAHPVIAAAGDIACDPESSNFNGGQGTGRKCRQMATSDIMLDLGVDAVLPLGDNQYHCGGASEFAASYDPSWGRLKAITHPVPGNHEYNDDEAECDRNASGYFNYFGAAAGDPNKGYYSYDLGAWHLIALNSACNRIGGCEAGSPQEQWLRADLAANPDRCTLAYWHHPRWSSGNRHGSYATVKDLVTALYDANADVILSGHDHNYERFALQDPDGVADPTDGIRQFVVGTGGKSTNGFNNPLPTSEARGEAPGVLTMTLRPDGYDWDFVPITGESYTDSGSDDCHSSGGAQPPNTSITSGPPASTANTSATFGFTASIPGSTFECSLDGSSFASCTSPRTYSGLATGAHSFRVRARSPDNVLDPTPAARSWVIEAADGTVSLSPVADATVTDSHPDDNFGDTTKLQADGSPLEEALLRFDASNLSGAVVSALLHLKVADGSSNGPAIYTTQGSWSESTVTWNNRPPRSGAPIADLDAVPSSGWVEIDVTGAVSTGNTVTFNLVSSHSNGTDFRSRESANAPELRLVLDDTTPPNTTITSGPPPVTAASTATFAFNGSAGAASFRCSLDGAAATGCASPTTYTGLDDGPHTFSVAAANGSGQIDQTPATWSWTVTNATESTVLEPVADATVRLDKPNTNYGATSRLKSDKDPKHRAYVKFDLSGLGQIQSAMLRVHVVNPTNDGPRIYKTSAAWAELSVTWDSRPSRDGGIVANVGRLHGGEWAEFDVTSAAAEGSVVSLELAPDSPNGVHFASREDGSAPQLVVVHTGEPAQLSFEAVADGYVDESEPDEAFGHANRLRADIEPVNQQSFLRFVVDVNRPVASATLRLWVTNGSNNGPWVGVASNVWSEDSLSWNNRPAPIGGGIANIETAPADQWIEYDVSSAVAGNGAVTFRLVGEVANGVIFGSRESSHPPTLIVVTTG